MPEKGNSKIRILFIDELNALQSQIAEYFLNEMFPDKYDVRSAGPRMDCVDCELVSVMYQRGNDIRRVISKDFTAKKMPDFDYLVFLEKATYDRIKDVVPYSCPHILMDFGSKADFKATDDKELYDCYVELIERVRNWVGETFSQPDNLGKLVR